MSTALLPHWAPVRTSAAWNPGFGHLSAQTGAGPDTVARTQDGCRGGLPDAGNITFHPYLV